MSNASYIREDGIATTEINAVAGAEWLDSDLYETLRADSRTHDVTDQGVVYVDDAGDAEEILNLIRAELDVVSVTRGLRRTMGDGSTGFVRA